ncbi:unnamed protein product [Peniophora sp. CBMAI 1063]|nr:unnamed protein product [Peniophora sp. CBMAI 1063]
MQHLEFPIVTFFNAVLLLDPIPFHYKSGNVAMLSMTIWLLLVNLVYGIDAILWAGTVLIKDKVWCDISNRILLGATVALPTACLCVTVHMEQIASVRSVLTTHKSRRRRQYYEAAACVLFPCVFVALHYIVEGHRFDILEDFGCRPSTYTSWPAIILVWTLPLALAIASLGFAGASLAHFMRRRISFAHHLQHRSALTTTKYMRLIMMSVVLMTWTVAVTAFTLYYNVPSIRPWTNWADVHSDFGRVDQYPLAFLPETTIRGQIVLWWFVPISAWIFIAFFAFGQEAMDQYRAVGSWVAQTVLRRKVQVAKLSGTSNFTKPTPPPLGSFGDMSMNTLASPSDKKRPSDASESLPSSKLSPSSFDHSWSETASQYTSTAGDETLYSPTTPIEGPPGLPHLSYASGKPNDSVV